MVAIFARLVVPKVLRQWADRKTEFRQALRPDRLAALGLLHSAIAGIHHKVAVAERMAVKADEHGSLLDLHSRRVIALRDLHANPFRVTAWAISNPTKKGPAIRALNMAIALR